MLAFWYPPPTRIQDLMEFHVAVSPLTYRIYAIFALGNPSELESCLVDARGRFAMIVKKYQGSKYGSELRQANDNRKFYLFQSKVRRRIGVGCEDSDGKSELVMGYIDEDTKKIAASEHAELAKLKAAIDAGKYEGTLARVTELAQTGNLWAATMLGVMYSKGQGVERDDDEAEKNYLLAAKRGWVNAEYNLGTLYMAQFRYQAAQSWLQRAADKEFPLAEENLAQLYLAKSPLRSEKEAFRWLLRAAEHGRPDSQYNTCHLYADGMGVEKDMVAAYRWCYIAGSYGDERAAKNRDHLAKQMQDDEVQRGRVEAERWLVKHPPPK